MKIKQEIKIVHKWEKVESILIWKVLVVEVTSLKGLKGILIGNAESGRNSLAASSCFSGGL